MYDSASLSRVPTLYSSRKQSLVVESIFAGKTVLVGATFSFIPIVVPCSQF